MEASFIIPGFGARQEIVLTVVADLKTNNATRKSHPDVWSNLYEATRLFAWAYELDTRGMGEAAKVLRDEGRKSYSHFLDGNGDNRAHQWTCWFMDDESGAL